MKLQDHPNSSQHIAERQRRLFFPGSGDRPCCPGKDRFFFSQIAPASADGRVCSLLTCDWTLIEASVGSDYMAFSWELILHLELIYSGGEHIMATVQSCHTQSTLNDERI